MTDEPRSEDITPCPICLRLVTDLVLCEHKKEKEGDQSRVDRQPDSDVALPQRATEPECTGPFSDAFECPVHSPLALAQTRFIPKRACEGAQTLCVFDDKERQCPHSQCGAVVVFPDVPTLQETTDAFRLACELGRNVDAVARGSASQHDPTTRENSPNSSFLIDQATALLKEMIRRARLFKKVGPAGSGITMSQLMQVEVVFSLGDEQIDREIAASFAALLADLTAKDHALATLTAELKSEREKHDEEAYNDMKAAKEALEAEQARLTKELAAPDDASGSGRVLLNDYGRRCWELGHAAGVWRNEPAVTEWKARAEAAEAALSRYSAIEKLIADWREKAKEYHRIYVSDYGYGRSVEVETLRKCANELSALHGDSAPQTDKESR